MTRSVWESLQASSSLCSCSWSSSASSLTAYPFPPRKKGEKAGPFFRIQRYSYSKPNIVSEEPHVFCPKNCESSLWFHLLPFDKSQRHDITQIPWFPPPRTASGLQRPSGSSALPLRVYWTPGSRRNEIRRFFQGLYTSFDCLWFKSSSSWTTCIAFCVVHTMRENQPQQHLAGLHNIQTKLKPMSRNTCHITNPTSVVGTKRQGFHSSKRLWLCLVSMKPCNYLDTTDTTQWFFQSLSQLRFEKPQRSPKKKKNTGPPAALRQWPQKIQPQGCASKH